MVVGTVTHFNARNGFGFLQPEGTEGKDNQVFVHWKNINSKSAWPKLEKDMEVQYSLEEINGKSQAVKVSLKGGKKIVNSDEKAKKYEKKKTRSGKIKFFDNKKSFGFVVPDDSKLELNGHSLDEKKTLYFTREDIVITEDVNSNRIKDNTEVTYTLYTVEGKDGLCAGKVTLPEKSYSEESLDGTVKFFDPKKGFGFITPEDKDIEFDDQTCKDGDCYFTRSDITRAEDGSAFIKDGMTVKFHVYTCAGNDGLCAGKITDAEGEPIVRSEEDKEKAAKRKAKWEAKNSNKKAKKNKKGGKKK